MRLAFSAKLLLPFLLGGVSGIALATEQDAATWLERMVRSAHQLNYTGTLVYQQGGSLQSMKIVHAVSDKGEQERLVSLSGPSREVLRNRDRVTCILPKDTPIVVEHVGTQRPFPVKLPRDLEPLREHYDIHLSGEDRIAGLKARKVVIVPKDRFRYGQNFWLAENNGLLLRAEVINEKGKIVEQVMFTSLQTMDSIPEEMLQPKSTANAKVLHLQHKPEKNAPVDSRAKWQVVNLPPGFTQQLQRNHYLQDKKYPVEHHVYSDGLASVSVFIERHDEDEDAFVGASNMGGVNAYGRILGEHSVTVVGEVPPVTVKQIAESLQAVQP
jgi:sigma-E factor negative regulatory protein RseB